MLWPLTKRGVKYTIGHFLCSVDKKYWAGTCFCELCMQSNIKTIYITVVQMFDYGYTHNRCKITQQWTCVNNCIILCLRYTYTCNAITLKCGCAKHLQALTWWAVWVQVQCIKAMPSSQHISYWSLSPNIICLWTLHAKRKISLSESKQSSGKSRNFLSEKF